MSREEAIEVIQNFMGWFKPDSRIYKALKMAIDALKYKTPCSLCRFREDNSGLCDMCPAMPCERGAE